ncbi:Xaa-Pro peptidase family protein [Sphingobium yanoikuyae]|uniref:Xaa-Pro peptidase family protein n=1 Tax=Sphingobium yanoikuyae TaxID=13690 RepID=A0AA43BA41_SPHYA|nr:Xaa-Pro peptidase family protein [Sphingobium yanoikuyae]MDH2134071.1 Xaa-Pro peptidase family protein [Sphingobium yanoikuyae]MDH2151453.1 Xaa-Pro peptidase family protein [Sphingobium yanoikuyae]MDH2169253.1 Xaa-Pro peptidase family protein [Sphingobium yanoikuyae]
MLTPDRRTLLRYAAAGATTALVSPRLFAQEKAVEALQSITRDVTPIGKAERADRLARAQKMMQAQGIDALLVEPGASLIYYSGIRWWRSERLTALVIPASGTPLVVCPFFEKPSIDESLAIPAEVRVWQEHESPYTPIADYLTARGLDKGRIGIEETVRYFAVDGLKAALPAATLVKDPVTRAIRMRKTAAEIALMQKAADVTMGAYRWTHPQVKAGMTPADIGALMTAATSALGGKGEFNLILLGEAAAYPHGSGKPQSVRAGEVVLMDCGCTVEDYQSDISRTFVYGAAPTAQQRKVWGEVAQGQQVAIQAAKLGVAAGTVDDAVRAYYEKLGYGPGYKLPGLSHRTGHGIGMEGHEPVNLVHGETTKLDVGMCFSNEPGLYLPGAMGVRMEDCFHMTAQGPQWFSRPPMSIEEPMG